MGWSGRYFYENIGTLEANMNNFRENSHRINTQNNAIVHVINISKDILTFVDSIKYQNIASDKREKYVLEHKNICKRRKVVVILQPQTGNDNDAPQAKREH